MEEQESRGLIRAMGRWTLTALVINSIIGSGIFGLPSVVAGYLGKQSPLAYLLAAAGIGVVIACFAEVASQFGAAGGPYLYAREAFGRFIGIEIGWLAFARASDRLGSRGKSLHELPGRILARRARAGHAALRARDLDRISRRGKYSRRQIRSGGKQLFHRGETRRR